MVKIHGECVCVCERERAATCATPPLCTLLRSHKCVQPHSCLPHVHAHTRTTLSLHALPHALTHLCSPTSLHTLVHSHTCATPSLHSPRVRCRNGSCFCSRTNTMSILFHGLCCHSSSGGLSTLLGGGSLIVFITYPLDEPSPGMHAQYIGVYMYILSYTLQE